MENLNYGPLKIAYASLLSLSILLKSQLCNLFQRKEMLCCQQVWTEQSELMTWLNIVTLGHLPHQNLPNSVVLQLKVHLEILWLLVQLNLMIFICGH